MFDDYLDWSPEASAKGVTRVAPFVFAVSAKTPDWHCLLLAACDELEMPTIAVTQLSCELLRQPSTKREACVDEVVKCDSGLVHHLLNISTHEDLLSHPVRGASWETFVIEDVLRREQLEHPDTQASFWRTAAGAEIDLVIERSGVRFGLEIKSARGDRPRAVRNLEEALDDIDAQRGWIIDQDVGIDRVSARVARAGFEQILRGTP